jgi:hypothetical protein
MKKNKRKRSLPQPTTARRPSPAHLARASPPSACPRPTRTPPAQPHTLACLACYGPARGVRARRRIRVAQRPPPPAAQHHASLAAVPSSPSLRMAQRYPPPLAHSHARCAWGRSHAPRPTPLHWPARLLVAWPA